MNNSTLSYRIWDSLKHTTESDTDMISIDIQYTQFYELSAIAEEDIRRSYCLPRNSFSLKKDQKSWQNVMGCILNMVSH
ncbi:hypothetical protein M5689_016884 [Euphorbia peplus]|nr:hypothetical protein M5689_016884 [Euphorbia peplus]